MILTSVGNNIVIKQNGSIHAIPLSQFFYKIQLGQFRVLTDEYSSVLESPVSKIKDGNGDLIGDEDAVFSYLSTVTNRALYGLTTNTVREVNLTAGNPVVIAGGYRSLFIAFDAVDGAIQLNDGFNTTGFPYRFTDMTVVKTFEAENGLNDIIIQGTGVVLITEAR